MIAVAGGILIVLLILAGLWLGFAMWADGDVAVGAFVLLAVCGAAFWIMF